MSRHYKFGIIGTSILIGVNTNYIGFSIEIITCPLDCDIPLSYAIDVNAGHPPNPQLHFVTEANKTITDNILCNQTIYTLNIFSSQKPAETLVELRHLYYIFIIPLRHLYYIFTIPL